jgi:hypothetical protein
MIKTTVKDGKTFAKLNDLQLWEQNPKDIDPTDYERLKKLIEKLGTHRPLLVNQDGIVLGGNQRLKVYQELKQADIWVSVVTAKDQQTMLEYALSDNDQAGKYIESGVAQLVQDNPGIDLSLFKVDLGTPIDLQGVLDMVQADGVDISLPSGEKGSLEQITFTLTNEQAETVRAAIDQEIADNDFTGSENTNKNGNAIHAICEAYLNGN